MPIAAEIYYSVHADSSEGQRPPVVLIHGAGGTHLFWPSEVRRLAGYRVYALDLPGHGKSGGRGLQTISAYCQAVRAWLEAVGLHSAVFVGHSMGSAIALTLALDDPEHVLGLGLIGASARLRVAADLLEYASNPAMQQKAIELIVQRSFSPQTPASFVRLAGKRLAEARPSVLYGDFCACNDFDEIARVGQIRAPTLIICGAEDQMTPPRFARSLSESIPNSTLKMIPSAGHMVMLEQPRATAAALAEFLAGIAYY
ncbi:MAG: alpha/beta hydrolase [Anaerolineales bacterium]|nr:alpha/beta hydrolase [Anaerolineales bacterium]